ncbi:acyl-CoA N-acyltransferase [Anaeromyces robustus]|uniref:Acyl-CoA N-acyltransferase n=1 Tax=Anaeromyces robustus TaxID=1754192 RepID=A0A1Y1X6E1_9FUNG|nr:acyl-CoA N-acyltransferase [Anaeromyces robustus]|eukprot:ORX80864.1 acyl-CoA N-acyltransferase [Anaeromyces robustus]
MENENNFLEIAKEEDIFEIYQLLKIVTTDLHNRGINQWTEEWKIEDIREFVLKQNFYVQRLEKKGEIIGMFSLEENKLLLEQFPKSLYLSKIALLPKYQKKDFGVKIIQKAIEIVHSQGKVVVLDCWSGNQKLKEYYTKLGFKYIRDLPEYDYYISVFSI